MQETMRFRSCAFRRTAGGSGADLSVRCPGHRERFIPSHESPGSSSPRLQYPTPLL